MTMLGVIPAAGAGSRIQPLAFSKELLPVGSRIQDGVEHPRAVGEYLVERLIAGGATRLCFVIAPGKSDILQYFGGRVDGIPVCYTVQEHPAGLCDALFRALPMAAEHESVAVGLPDTIWFPADGLRLLTAPALSFLLFPVTRPELFDAVCIDETGRVEAIDVKKKDARSNWIWGAFKLPSTVLGQLAALWSARERRDEYFGTLVSAYLEHGGRAVGVKGGQAYVDVGTLHGYREALRLLASNEFGGHAMEAQP
jgi:glucose-1-phosphate thymidylyltransferase